MASNASNSKSTARVDDDSGQEPELQEDDLISLETLDRNSPELWPEENRTAVPSTLELAANALQDGVIPPWEQSFNSEDLSLLHHYGSLTLSALIVEVRKLYEKSFQLGLEESREMARGRLLNILGRRRMEPQPEQ